MSLVVQNNTQNELLMKNLMDFYKDQDHLHKMMRIINGESPISLRIVDWFVTNYSKKNYVVYEIPGARESVRFKVYNDYKLKLKSYSKKRFDPFCRWERISIPYDKEKCMETTIGQLNFFKWAIENNILEYIEENHEHIECDMNSRNSTSKRKYDTKPGKDEEIEPLEESDIVVGNDNKTRKKREELSVSACKFIKKEMVKIVVKFS
jgi:hypothetical protein